MIYCIYIYRYAVYIDINICIYTVYVDVYIHIHVYRCMYTVYVNIDNRYVCILYRYVYINEYTVPKKFVQVIEFSRSSCV